MCTWIVRMITSLAAIATLIGVAQCFGAVEHGNVAFDVSPDGKRLVFSAADGDLYLFRFETRHVDCDGSPLRFSPFQELAMHTTKLLKV
jgi:hypothetical protein